MPRDHTPADFPDGDSESQSRYIQQQIAENLRAEDVSHGERRVKRAGIGSLIAYDRYRQEMENKSSRMFSVLSARPHR